MIKYVLSNLKRKHRNVRTFCHESNNFTSCSAAIAYDDDAQMYKISVVAYDENRKGVYYFKSEAVEYVHIIFHLKYIQQHWVAKRII